MPTARTMYSTLLLLLKDMEPAMPDHVVAEMAADLRAIITQAQRRAAQEGREIRRRTRHAPGLNYVEGEW